MAKSKSGQFKIISIVAIIILLLILLVPLLNKSRRINGTPSQQAQFHSIDAAVELFNSEFDGYPPSDALGPVGRPYCGAMKLAEAMMGQDLMGFHPDSVFNFDGTNSAKKLYPEQGSISEDEYNNNLSIRKGPYLPLENANAYQLADVYGPANTSPFSPDHFVLCDVHRNVVHNTTGKKIGMPILYYKADTSKTAHDINDPNNPDNIFDYKDNHALLALGVPGRPGVKHPMYEDPMIFYKMICDYKNKKNKPIRSDFILVSAGRDGLYGTKDDIVNFDMQWKFK